MKQIKAELSGLVQGEGSPEPPTPLPTQVPEAPPGRRAQGEARAKVRRPRGQRGLEGRAESHGQMCDALWQEPFTAGSQYGSWFELPQKQTLGQGVERK